MTKIIGFFVLAFGFTVTVEASDIPPKSCTLAYEQIRSQKLSEAVDSMAQCGKETPVDKRQTVMLYERALVLQKLDRKDEALAQMIALTEKPHFETGLADAFSGPGAWSRDPEQIQRRQATGISRANFLLDIAWNALGVKNPKAAIEWSEKSAKHALTRFRPEDEWLPMDADAGCAIALRGFARADLGDNQRALIDLMRSYIRGCDKLPVAEKAELLDADSRKKVESLKLQFKSLQAENTRVTEENRHRNKLAAAKSSSGSGTESFAQQALITTVTLSNNIKAVEPVMKQRLAFLAEEAKVLGPEPLFDTEPK